jgi:hypothetical protein
LPAVGAAAYPLYDLISAFTRIAGSRGTCWTSGLRSIDGRCTKPPCTWRRPSGLP